MARTHIYECNTPQDGNVIVVYQPRTHKPAAPPYLCDTSKEALDAYFQLCDKDNPNEISFQPPETEVVKDSTNVRGLHQKGVDLFKQLLSPSFV